MELGKGRRDFRDWHCGALHHLRLRFRPYALSRQSDAAERNADFPDVPAVLSLVALYALFNGLGEYIPFIGLNTHGGVIFAYLGGIALHVWTIKGYFETIDSSLEEAAALDGATPWQAFRLVLLPLSVPILAVVFILSFIAAITEVPVASLLLRDVNGCPGRGGCSNTSTRKTTCGVTLPPLP